MDDLVLDHAFPTDAPAELRDAVGGMGNQIYHCNRKMDVMLFDIGVEMGYIYIGADVKVGIAPIAEHFKMIAAWQGFRVNLAHGSPPFKLLIHCTAKVFPKNILDYF
jgi:hypothetical protein